MVRNLMPIRGKVRGSTIQLEQAVDLPDGQEVTVELTVVSSEGAGMRSAFGAWADDAQGLDEFLSQVRRDREKDQREPLA